MSRSDIARATAAAARKRLRRYPLARAAVRVARLPQQWWVRQSLRARVALLATALFSFAVVTGAVLLIVLQRYALYRTLDQSAGRTARDIVAQVTAPRVTHQTVLPTTGGIYAVQVVDRDNAVIAESPGVPTAFQPIMPDPADLQRARNGERLTITSLTSDVPLRVYAVKAPHGRTVVVFTDLSRVDDSLRLLSNAALIGSPIAVLVMALATYAVVSITLRPVAALRHGAADITAAGLAEQRLPVPRAQDEIHRLAHTLNAMLDRIDSATSRQRTFVGDAAHELRSPLASLRVQLEVAQRLGAEAVWSDVVDDVLVDVERLDRLVADLLALARLDEATTLTRREPVRLDELVASVVDGYGHARVPVTASSVPVVVDGDPDALRRVVVNLVNNAVRHAASAVEVTVDRGRRGGATVARLSVVDDGPGIPESERERVFDRFYRVQASRSRDSGGTGLGLPIVREIVHTHGGRVRLASRPDDRPGVCAIVVLPERPQRPADAPLTPR